MLIKIGDKEITKSTNGQYTVQTYSGGSIGIRGRVKSEADIKSTEKELYGLREGSVANIEVLTDEGDAMVGSYKINELHWGKERGRADDYELVFNIGLQKQ